MFRFGVAPMLNQLSFTFEQCAHRTDPAHFYFVGFQAKLTGISHSRRGGSVLYFNNYHAGSRCLERISKTKKF